MNQAITIAGVEERACITRDLPIHGALSNVSRSNVSRSNVSRSNMSGDGQLWVHGTDAEAVASLAATLRLRRASTSGAHHPPADRMGCPSCAGANGG